MLITKKIIGFAKKKTTISIDRFTVGDIIEIKYEIRKGYWALKTFTGICIAKKNLNERTKVIIRNVINNISIEYNFFLYSPDIVNIKKIKKSIIFKHNKGKLYYLRTKSLNQSKV